MLSPTQFQTLVESFGDAVYIMDEYRNIVYANSTASFQTGYSNQELLSMNISSLDPVYPKTLPEGFHRYARSGQKRVFETEHRRRDGSRYPVEISLSFDRSREKLLVYAVVRDITDRKHSRRITEEMRFALEHVSDAIYLYDREGWIFYVNEAACEVLGYRYEELTRMNIRDIDQNFQSPLSAMDWNKGEYSRQGFIISKHKRKDGSLVPVEILASRSVVAEVESAVAFVRDISERLEVEEVLKEGEERFRVIMDTSPVGLITTEVGDGTIQYANTQVERLFGVSRTAFLTMDIRQLFQRGGIGEDVINDVLAGHEMSNHEVQLLGVSEHPVWVSISTRTIELSGERVCCCAMMDVTEAKELSNQLSYHATYDDLTGLVNRREFEDRLQEVIDLAAVYHNENVLCYLDLDQFKIINDTCGHMAGDELLRQVAQLLCGCVRQDDLLARLGGDEFAILLENCVMENAERIADKIRLMIQDYRFTWDDNTFKISVSMGLVPISPEAETITDVMRRADTACYAAKDAGRNRIHISHLDDVELLQRHGEMQWISRINDALDQDKLELWRQKIAPANASVKGDHYEILLRMQGDDGEIALPGSFLPAAERYDLAPRIDRWVVNAVFNWFTGRPQEIGGLGCCSINLSGQSLSDSSFLQEVIQRFQESGIPPHKFCFEITETAAIANLSNATHFMRSLKELGCAFALDDFGSGLSSFAYLKNLPVDYVKIDGFFVKDVMADPVDLAMVKAINDMAHALGKLTIAEFVEDSAIHERLIELGVDFVQGYGITRPEPLKAS